MEFKVFTYAILRQVRVTRLGNINHLFCRHSKNLRCPTVSLVGPLIRNLFDKEDTLNRPIYIPRYNPDFNLFQNEIFFIENAPKCIVLTFINPFIYQHQNITSKSIQIFLAANNNNNENE